MMSIAIPCAPACPHRDPDAGPGGRAKALPLSAEGYIRRSRSFVGDNLPKRGRTAFVITGGIILLSLFAARVPQNLLLCRKELVHAHVRIHVGTHRLFFFLLCISPL